MSPTRKVTKPKAKPAAKKPAPAKPAPAAAKRAAEPKAKDARKAAKPARKETAPARKPAPGARGAARPAASGDPKARLGAKHVCYKCGAKFYDLNKPEPICPKCGTDQRTRPKVEAKAKPSAAAGQRRQVTRPMVPLLDDEEDGDDVLVDEELDLEGVEESPDDFLDEEEEEPEEPSEP
jgi:hypothetical protein